MNKNIIKYYTEIFNESERHQNGFGQIQQERTLEILFEYLNKPCKIADIGGATGVYSFELAKAGHSVHLIDIVPAHIDQAEKNSLKNGISLDGYHISDARNLNFQNNFFDTLILHGPLYHLTSSTERKQVLDEALRVLQPGGLLFAFAINRYAGLFYGINSELILNDSYFKMIKSEIESGQREREPSWYFHLPSELETELISSGFKVTETKGVVSPIWMLPDIDKKLSDDKLKTKILNISKLLEAEPIIGQDFVCIGQKPFN